jgi:hypothetical protein
VYSCICVEIYFHLCIFDFVTRTGMLLCHAFCDRHRMKAVGRCCVNCLGLELKTVHVQWHVCKDCGVALAAAMFGFECVCVCFVTRFLCTHPLLCCESSLQIGAGRERGSDCFQHQVWAVFFLASLVLSFLSHRRPMAVLGPRCH